MDEKEILIPFPHDDDFDALVCAELRWEAPPELTVRLLALVSPVPAWDSADGNITFVNSRPHTWYSRLVIVLTFLAVAVSCTFAWNFYGAVGVELGLPTLWQQLEQLPTMWLSWLYDEMPATRSVVDILVTLQGQLHWIIVFVVLWLTLDNRVPRSSLHRQQT